MSRLTFSGLTKRFGPITAVDDVALDISSGEFVSLVGASGCGKTTLLRMIAGFTRPDAGEMTIEGRRVDVLPPSRREVGFVFQSYALFPTQTVAGNIGFSLRIRRRDRREIEERVGELCRLTQLTGLEDRYPHELSGGQQQRVALARALAPNPAILLLDEPLSALDAKIRAHLRTEIRRIVDRLGITTVYVTHDQEEALSISDRVAVMHRGRILQVGPPMELYLDPVHRYVAEFIGTSNRLAGRALGGGRFETEGMTVEARCPTPLDGAGECVVCVRPEHVELMHGANEIGYASGRVVSTSFLGPTVRCRLETANGSELVVDVSTVEWLDKALSLGDAVAWRVRASRAMAFPPGEAGAGQGEPEA